MQDDERRREKRLRLIWRTQGRTFGRIEKLGIPRTVLDARRIGLKLAECRWRVAGIEEEDAGSRRRGGLGKIREDRRDGFSKIREDCDGGFVQSYRKTRKRLEKTDGTTNVNRSNKFDVLNQTESGLEFEEVNAVDVVQEILEITVDSIAAKSVWPSRKKGVTRTTATKTARLAAASGSPIHEGGDAKLGIRL